MKVFVSIYLLLNYFYFLSICRYMVSDDDKVSVIIKFTVPSWVCCIF